MVYDITQCPDCYGAKIEKHVNQAQQPNNQQVSTVTPSMRVQTIALCLMVGTIPALLLVTILVLAPGGIDVVDMAFGAAMLAMIAVAVGGIIKAATLRSIKGNISAGRVACEICGYSWIDEP